MIPVLVTVAMIVWLDRRVWAFVQKRRGPNVVGPFGLLQSLADALKYIFKEIIIPASSNKVIFILAPIVTMTLALIAWAVIPFSDEFVLKDISLTIEKNKSTIILGQSGCGKSVLIKTIYKLFYFDSGSILYDGKSEVDIDKFSMLFQYGALFDSLKISENIAFTDFINNKTNYERKVISLMNDVGLDKSIFDKYPSEISGGDDKKSSICQSSL